MLLNSLRERRGKKYISIMRLQLLLWLLLVTADQPVSVHVTFDKNYRSESYTAMPISAYDTSFTIATFLGNSVLCRRAGFLITSAEDGTTVTITPSVTVGAKIVHDSGI